MKYKAVIFDFDYTLGDCTEGIAASVNHGLKKLGYEAGELEDIRKTIGLSLKETFSCLTGSRDQEEAQRFSVCFKEKSDQVMVDRTRLYPAVRPVFEELRRQGRRIGIVTTKYHYRIDQILDKFFMPWSSWGRTGAKSFIQGTAWWTQRQRPRPLWILPAY